MGELSVRRPRVLPGGLADAPPATLDSAPAPSADPSSSHPAVPLPRAAAGSPTSGRRVHAVAVIDTDDELVAVVLRWLRDGLAAGELTAAVVSPQVAEQVRAQLPAVEVMERGDGSPREPDAIAAQLELLERARSEGRGLRLLGQVYERDRRHWDERVRGELAHQHLFAQEAMVSLCVYDRRSTPADVLAMMLGLHPEVVERGLRRPSGAHLTPAEVMARLELPVEPLQDTAPVFAVEDAPSLPELRHQLARALHGRGTDGDAEQDFHLAISEIAANAFRHGGRPVSARLWASEDRLVCTISDGGTSFPGLFAGYRPAHGEDLSRGGMGLWLARKLCDHVDLHSSPTGFTVRLSTAVSRPAPA